MKKSKVITQLLIFVGILVVVNLICEKLFFRLDFTANKQYTLSKATKKIIKDLDDVVTVTAYFTKDLPPQLQKNKKDFEDLLIEYENRSGGNIVYEFVNPNKDQESEQDAQQKGISPVMVNVTQKDQVQQLRAYMGAVLQMGEKKEVIPLIQPGSSIEYALTTAIKKLSVTNKPKIAFLQGQGEPSMQASSQLVQQLSVLYNPEQYTITDTANIPADYKAIAIIDPSDTFPQRYLSKLDAYLNSGGSIFLAYGNLQSNLNSQYLQANPDIGLKKWLASKGLTLNDQYVIDASCGSVSVRQGNIPIPFQIQFPYFPIISNFSDHPAVEGLESVFLPFVSPITYSPIDSAETIQPLAFSSDKSGLVSAPTYIDINKRWQESDFNSPKQVVAVALSGPIAGSGNAKMVVVTNGSFVVNGEGQQQQQLNEDNVNFASNSIDWLSDDTGLIDLRTKGVTSRPLKQVDDTKRNLYKWGNVIFPILLILIIGFIRRQRYQKKRQQWIQGNY